MRFTPDAAAAMRGAIREAGGIEIFCVGEVVDRTVTTIEVHARGTDDAVLALLSRPRSGNVVIHNHPSGVVKPSAADMEMAGRFGEDGVGFVIVDNEVGRDLWVVEPAARKQTPVDPARLVEFFERTLPRLLPGWEPRPGQVDMAQAVAAGLVEPGLVILEAGTGTGKSLAYLVPAAMWAMQNDTKVVVSTYTRTLQGQLVTDDLPVVARALSGFRHALLKGRNNYVCRRKLGIVVREGEGAAVADWVATSETGDVGDAGFDIPEELWERVESDSDQTLRARCRHFNECFYYQARRRAAAAHVVVVNHALLLADLALKQGTAPGILPRFDRVVLDEAHHLEQAATSVSAVRLSAITITRAVAPLLPRAHRPGALDRLGDKVEGVGETLDQLLGVRDSVRIGFEQLGEGRTQPERVRGAPPEAAFFAELADDLDKVTARLGALAAPFADQWPSELVQPLLDIGRAKRRLEGAADAARRFLVEDADQVRFLDPGQRGIGAARAPVDVGPFLRQGLAEKAAVLTSATLAVNGRIDHYEGRVGLAGAFAQYPSPFDYFEQALLVTPRDLPPPTAADFGERVAPVIAEAVRASRGGAFVLCTSHAAVKELSQRVGALLAGEHTILTQGAGARQRLLERFRGDRGAVLFGTDSFWEGVSVRGEGLRLVIIPRLPFRVPTEPVAEARYERLQERGLDPFRAYSLPEAVIKLRQGFGRLVRSRTDRGAVVILDRRLHDMWYGRVFLASLPPARRINGPARVVIEQLRVFYREMLGG